MREEFWEDLEKAPCQVEVKLELYLAFTFELLLPTSDMDFDSSSFDLSRGDSLPVGNSESIRTPRLPEAYAPYNKPSQIPRKKMLFRYPYLDTLDKS